MEVKLVDKGTYLDGLGHPVTVEDTHDGSSMPFVGISPEDRRHMRYMSDGRYVEFDSPCSILDLVERIG